MSDEQLPGHLAASQQFAPFACERQRRFKEEEDNEYRADGG
jgi:hypothetical protein